MDQIDSLEYYMYNVMKRILRRNCVSCKYSNLLAINQLFTSKTATARDKLLPKHYIKTQFMYVICPIYRKKEQNLLSFSSQNGCKFEQRQWSLTYL